MVQYFIDGAIDNELHQSLYDNNKENILPHNITLLSECFSLCLSIHIQFCLPITQSNNRSSSAMLLDLRPTLSPSYCSPI